MEGRASRVGGGGVGYKHIEFVKTMHSVLHRYVSAVCTACERAPQYAAPRNTALDAAHICIYRIIAPTLAECRILVARRHAT